MTELKRIDFETGKFTANDVNYTVSQYLSIERYCEFQILEKELAYGTSFEAMYRNLDRAEQELNKTHFVDAAVLLADIKRGILKVQEREPVVLKICALFINADGEDLTKITADMIELKIHNWKVEGLSMNDFFTVAASSVNGFLGIYQSVTQSILAVLRPKDPGKEQSAQTNKSTHAKQ